MNEYDIRSMTLEELQAVMEKIGEKPFKAKQIYQWLHEKCAADYEAVSYTHLRKKGVDFDRDPDDCERA